MPVMSEPLAHLQMLLDDIVFDIKHMRLEREKLDAKISVLEDYAKRAQLALIEEGKKLPK